MNAVDAVGVKYFDSIHVDPDPFGYRTRWYESRKRQLLLATLPRQRFEAGWEMGCSNGELTAALAGRCNNLLATDISCNAAEHARWRTRLLGKVTVEQMSHPSQWPVGQFDLIVMSEVGYYMTAAGLDEVIDRLEGSLSKGGIFVACHWLHPFSQACQDGGQVHARFAERLTVPLLYSYQDSDFVLEAWGGNEQSVAQLEGLR